MALAATGQRTNPTEGAVTVAPGVLHGNWPGKRKGPDPYTESSPHGAKAGS